MLADRSSVNGMGRQEWRLRLHFAIFPGQEYDESQGTAAIAEYAGGPESGIRILHLVMV